LFRTHDSSFPFDTSSYNKSLEISIKSQGRSLNARKRPKCAPTGLKLNIVNVIQILDKNIEKSACLRRLKPFLKEGFKNPKNFKKEMIQDTRGQQVSS